MSATSHQLNSQSPNQVLGSAQNTVTDRNSMAERHKKPSQQAHIPEKKQTAYQKYDNYLKIWMDSY